MSGVRYRAIDGTIRTVPTWRDQPPALRLVKVTGASARRERELDEIRSDVAAHRDPLWLRALRWVMP